jgi:hypothetical protein
MTTATREATGARGWPPRVAALLTAFALLLTGAMAGPARAEPANGYGLHQVYWGITDLGRLIIDYRIRHQDVGGGANVAVFQLTRPDGTVEYHGAASVGTVPRAVAIGKVDRWVVKDGRPVFDRTIDVPNMGNKHSEQVVRAALGDADAALVRRGESELKPCQLPTNQCRARLRAQWFSGLTDMNYNYRYGDTVASYTASNGKVRPSSDNRIGVAEKVRRHDQWVKDGRPRSGRRFANESFTTPGSPAAPETGVIGALTGAQKTGGIDFSSLELRYLADPPPGGDQGIRFSFTGKPTTSATKADVGRAVTLQASDAFFVWLSLRPSQFWVNLNPDEPDRIVDPKLGTTDVGRIMLQSDLQMKKTVAKLIHPNRPAGAKYWAALRGDTKCVGMRQWIVPGPTTVHEDEGQLYILDAPLVVKMESDYTRAKGVGGVGNCGNQSAADTKHNEKVYRSRILPQMQKAVNTAPEYAELRRIYLSRVAAQWYVQRSAEQDTIYSDLVGSGDVTAWPARRKWSPKQVFDAYVRSYTKGEFTVKRKTRKGNYIYTYTYVYGGVDFGVVGYSNLDRGTFDTRFQGLPGQVAQSMQRPTADGNGELWFGSRAEPPVRVAEPTPPTVAAFSGAAKAIAIALLVVCPLLVVGAVLTVVLVVRRSSRRRPAARATGPVS